MRVAIRVPQASEAHTRAHRKYTHSFPDYHPRYDMVSHATAQLRRHWFRVVMFKFRAELGGPAAPKSVLNETVLQNAIGDCF